MNNESTPLSDPVLATVEIDGISRSSFILKGALAAGAVYGASTVAPFAASRCPGRPRTSRQNRDRFSEIRGRHHETHLANR